MGDLLLVGCGKMGGAMLEGWLARGLSCRGCRRRRAGRCAAAAHVGRARRRLDVRRGQDARRSSCWRSSRSRWTASLPDLKRFADEGAVFLSIAAGKTLKYFASHLGTTAKVVRSMPNTPAAVRQGIRVATAAGGVSEAEKKRCHQLLEAVGQVVWVDDEALMDPVTALSGSGPAYVFLLVEAMAAAGAKLGLTPDMAMQLARATVAGSGELLKQSSEPASQLRVNVTSPGGTTAEALKVLMAADGIQPVFDKALAAASRRSKELAG